MTNDDGVRMSDKSWVETHLTLKNLLKLINYIILPVLILLTWEMVVRLKMVSPAILPSIRQVVSTFVEMLKNGELITNLTASLLRLIKGYSWGVFFGIVFGIVMGISICAHRLFTFVFDAIRQIPAMAWIPLIILWFGIGDLSKVVLIFKAAFFPVLLNTISGIVNAPKSFLEVAKLHQVSKRRIILQVYAPASLPSILVGLRLGLGASWMTMVAAELIAASSGIGYLINDGRQLSQPDLVIVGMIVIGCIGVTMDLFLKKLGQALMKWQGHS